MTLIANADNPNTAGPHPGSHRVSYASFNRPANTTAYGARDVISDSTTAVIEFPDCGRSGQILRGMVLIEEDAAPAFTFELYIFDSEPTNHADNAALTLVSADLPRLVAVLDFAAADVKTLDETATAATGFTAYPQHNGDTSGAANGLSMPHSYVTDPTETTGRRGSLFGLLVTQTAQAFNANSTKIHIRLEVQID